MEAKEWQTFVTVVEEGNITKAAEKLFLSQPALSYRLKQVEDILGRPLLIRANDGIALTAEGELYYDYCRRMIRSREELRQNIGKVTGKIQGTLKIAASINFADYELPHLLNNFTKQYPKIRIEVKTGYSSHVNKMFNSGEVMIAFARGEYNHVPNGVRLFDEPYCLVYKHPVDYKELRDIPMLNYRTDGSIATVVENWKKEHSVGDVRPAMELDSMVTCRHFVREGLGWAILPYLGLGSCREHGIYVEPLRMKDDRPLVRSTYLFHDEVSTKLIAVKTFIDYVTEYYENHQVVTLPGYTS